VAARKKRRRREHLHALLAEDDLVEARAHEGESIGNLLDCLHVRSFE
jgi:hypothetical protein